MFSDRALMPSSSFFGGPTNDATSGDVASSIRTVLLCSIVALSPQTPWAISNVRRSSSFLKVTSTPFRQFAAPCPLSDLLLLLFEGYRHLGSPRRYRRTKISLRNPPAARRSHQSYKPRL